MGPGALPPAPAVLLGPLLPALRSLPSTSRPFLNGTGIPSHQACCSTITSVSRCLRVWLGLRCLRGTRSSLPGAAPALPHLLGSGTQCSPTPSVGRTGAASVLCVFLGPRSVGSRGARRRGGVGSSVPLRHCSARLLWWVPPAWSQALDPGKENRLRSGSPLHSSGPLLVLVRRVLHLGALPLPTLGLPRSSCGAFAEVTSQTRALSSVSGRRVLPDTELKARVEVQG